MTGIERLRKLGQDYKNVSDAQKYLGINVRREADLLNNIADQIEREAKAPFSRMRVLSVITEMERHVLGHEGMEDSPVARWARELRAALTSNEVEKVKRDPSKDVSMSAYDLLPQDEREAIAWVREHGGVEFLDLHWGNMHRLVAEVARRLGYRPDCEDCEPDELLEALDRRLMPEGMEWPKVDGEPVVIGERLVGYGSGDDGYEVVGVRPTCGWVLVKSCDHIRRDGGPVILEWDASKCHRPAPKVLDADGVECHVGDTVWHVETGEQCNVVEVDSRSVSVDFLVDGDGTKHTGSVLPVNLTHRAPVLAADGRPLREGETVWSVDSGTRYTVEKITDELIPIKCCSEMGSTVSLHPSQLTHERPDSWERLEEDAGKSPCDYFGFDEDETCGKCPASAKNCEQTMARDIVRRAKALAERDA